MSDLRKHYKPGDSCKMDHPRGSTMGVVREVTPKRVYVWTGETGFGQKRWPFDDKGRPVGTTKVAFPNLSLDLNYADPFLPPGTSKG